MVVAICSMGNSKRFPNRPTKAELKKVFPLSKWVDLYLDHDLVGTIRF